MRLLSGTVVRNAILLSSSCYVLSIIYTNSWVSSVGATLFVDKTCPLHTYETVLVSVDPMVIYIRNFITEAETAHLLEQRGKFQPSEVYNPGQQAHLDTDVRNSIYFDIEESEDSVVACIRQRALSFQGYGHHVKVEKSRVQRYDQQGHFTSHYDAEDDRTALRVKGNRIATMMLYLTAPSSGGGTIFPGLETNFNPPDRCSVIDCEGDGRNGTTFRPVARNALFWMNVHKDGRLHLNTYHAGLPVSSGVKTIMNIWLWQRWIVKPLWAKNIEV